MRTNRRLIWPPVVVRKDIEDALLAGTVIPLGGWHEAAGTPVVAFRRHLYTQGLQKRLRLPIFPA